MWYKNVLILFLIAIVLPFAACGRSNSDIYDYANGQQEADEPEVEVLTVLAPREIRLFLTRARNNLNAIWRESGRGQLYLDITTYAAEDIPDVIMRKNTM